MTTITVTEARARLREALELVKGGEGETVELSQNGQVVAVLIHPSQLRTRVRTPNTIAAEQRLATLRDLKNQPAKHTRSKISPERAKTLAKDLQQKRKQD